MSIQRLTYLKEKLASRKTIGDEQRIKNTTIKLAKHYETMDNHANAASYYEDAELHLDAAKAWKHSIGEKIEDAILPQEEQDEVARESVAINYKKAGFFKKAAKYYRQVGNEEAAKEMDKEADDEADTHHFVNSGNDSDNNSDRSTNS